MQNGNGHGAIDYSSLIKDDAVHGRVFYDPDIYEEEMEKIFGRNWIYVGHDSEVREPGEFVTRQIGNTPVIMVRGKDNKVRLFLNRCRHRLNTVCMAEFGKSPGGFRCIYHGWSYATTGELVGVPYPEGFDPRDFNKADYPLVEVPMDSYRGLIFGNLKPSEDLKSFLGAVTCRHIDQTFDLSPEGELEVRSRALKSKFNANWKVAMDNSVDGYHALFLHVSSFPIGRDNGFDLTSIYSTAGSHRLLDLGHGHAQSDMSLANKATGGFFAQLMNRDTTPEDQHVYTEALIKRLGRERAQEVMGLSDPGPLTVFPTFNLILGEIRIYQPVSPFETEVFYYPALLKGAPRSLNAARMQQESFIHGPAGVVTLDDVEMYERAQMAVNARKEEWLLLKRGLRTEEHEEDAIVGLSHHETSNRALWRHYGKVMSA